MGKYISVRVDAEVCLGDIDTEDLVEELSTRGDIGAKETVSLIPPLNGEVVHPLHEIYYAFKFGLTDRATELARAYCCDELGVVL